MMKHRSLSTLAALALLAGWITSAWAAPLPELQAKR